LIALFESAVAKHDGGGARLALVAVGGYGRGELAPFSDLDVVLIHDVKARKVAKLVEPAASAIWYPIWDSGVTLGHGVRHVDEQVALARDDFDTATAALTTRPLAGDDDLVDELRARSERLWRDASRRHLEELHRRTVERQRRSADVAYHLEPDLKDGHGGIRDVQSLWWAQVAGLSIPASDEAELEHCYDTLLRARVALHQATGRSGDVVRLENQDETAERGGWNDADQMMADIAAAGRTVAWLCDETWGRAFAPSKPPADQRVAPGVVLRGGEIDLADGASPASDPTLVLTAAVAAARHEARIARPALERLSDETDEWSGAWPTGATDELVNLLLQKKRAIPVLEALDQRALLSRLLPEWEPVRSKPQRNAYHRYTVDRHLWEAATNAAELVDRVARPDLLILGALFHDIGKGYPGDHTEVGMVLVREIGPRLGVVTADVDTLVAMVEHHLLLPDVAVRRDLTDPGTIAQVADAVGTVERLDLLHALTEADSLATGPSAWGSWKEELVNELVGRVRHSLGGGDLGDVSWRLFPDADTLERMASGERHLTAGDDLLTVVTPDDPGVLSQVAGVLALHGLDVLTARASSDAHGMAASQFRVIHPDRDIDWSADGDWGDVRADLHHALDRELAVEARIAERARTYRRRRPTQAQPPSPPSVTFDDAASSDATIIEVRAESTIGILHRITKALTELGLDIRHATAQTIGVDVIDTFYVRGRSGLVTDPFHRDEIQNALLYAVAPPIS
ncbi:MAG: [protein-PII] uridylyltransferase, partial [Actinomycetota bacterium]